MSTPLRVSRRPVVLALALFGVAACTQINPITMGERVTEDRSADDIAKDTKIFSKANAAMVDNKTLAVSTLVYEQVLVAYGVMDDQKKMEDLHAAFRNIEGVKQLYWEVQYMSDEEQKNHQPPLMNAAETTKVQGEIEANWLDAKGVQSPNFRVGVDPLGHAFLLGRAHTSAEKSRALGIVRGVEGVREVTEHIYVQP